MILINTDKLTTPLQKQEVKTIKLTSDAQTDNQVDDKVVSYYDLFYQIINKGGGTYALYNIVSNSISENYKSMEPKKIYDEEGFEMTYSDGLKSFSNKNNLSSRTLKYTKLDGVKLGKYQSIYYETTNRDGTKNLQTSLFLAQNFIRDNPPSARNYTTFEISKAFDKTFIKTTHRDGTYALYNHDMERKTINFNFIDKEECNGVWLFKLFSSATQNTYFYDPDLKEHEKYRIVGPWYKRHQKTIIVTTTVGSLSVIALITGLTIWLKKRTK